MTITNQLSRDDVKIRMRRLLILSQEKHGENEKYVLELSCLYSNGESIRYKVEIEPSNYILDDCFEDLFSDRGIVKCAHNWVQALNHEDVGRGRKYKLEGIKKLSDDSE